MRIIVLFLCICLPLVPNDSLGQRWFKEKYETLQKLGNLYEINITELEKVDSLSVGSEAASFYSKYAYGAAPPFLAYNSLENYKKEEPWVRQFMESPYTPRLPLRMKDDEPWTHFFQWIKQYELGTYILINIPSAMLTAYDGDGQLFESKIIVGTRTNQTPVLATKASYITIYPYWTPTYNILFNEIIPKQIEDSTYLARNLFEVLNRKGKRVNPSTVVWKEAKRGSFPYTVRQSTGCDNSLGLLKIHIDNPYSIYLHDTPHTRKNKDLFNREKRFFSHGCIRLEKPLELVNLLEPLEAIDEDLMNKCLLKQQPKDIKLKNEIPVFIMYFTKYLNRQGEWVEVEDYYGLGEG